MPSKPRVAAIVILFIAIVSTIFALRPIANDGGATTTGESSTPGAPAAAPATAPEASGSLLPTTRDEPTQEACDAAVNEVRNLASALPAEHPSRYFAERDLHQSLVEAGNGEFDDCLFWAERALLEVRELRHELKPGEKIEVLQPDETPAKTEPAGKTTSKTTDKAGQAKARH